jgi:CheY-like chemotaxis protein
VLSVEGQLLSINWHIVAGGRKVNQSVETKVDLYIVVADDNVEDHHLIARATKDCQVNHLITSVYNGVQLINLLNSEGFYKTSAPRLPDFIILDLSMPIMDGFEVLKYVRGVERFARLPIYVLSNSTSQADRIRCEELGATRFYTKPLDYEKLSDIISSMCNEVGLSIRSQKTAERD